MKRILTRCIQEFENDEATMLEYEAVRKTFMNYPENINKLGVLLKFTVLNGLYRTNIFDKKKIADHIYRLATEENLDAIIKAGNPEAINKIRLGHGIPDINREHNFYSFATKYCHFSNPNCYPIYDQYVKKAILKLKKENYIQFRNQNDLYDPQTFREIFDQIIQEFELNEYQKADRALWIYGQHLAEKWIISELPI
jgi:hypothetical protein